MLFVRRVNTNSTVIIILYQAKHSTLSLYFVVLLFMNFIAVATLIVVVLFFDPLDALDCVITRPTRPNK